MQKSYTAVLLNDNGGFGVLVFRGTHITEVMDEAIRRMRLADVEVLAMVPGELTLEQCRESSPHVAKRMAA